jgi:hypothetical protein
LRLPLQDEVSYRCIALSRGKKGIKGKGSEE